ncbi:5'-3' exonuclease [Paenibacillus macerans]|uniref:5'-3' exonuclease n=1 Tax=Paenibacillus macerans TaxID=44252 RepID=A0A090Z9R0_PAEMA|nr:5'-3' exonuclease H3TH domain-containing protein [Paenibacillus macerans]KFN08009.1 5'-3' exonuclease [Paenibacillus macerans]MCY7560032.1 5'-3' exonuclease [Paenibacillus macerans]MEC0151969.1 5'-3' exonuclease H3TH domain-containing protein [Paenibacillus macerans]MEC0329720.1 5'-3' exonuclease H3TH domain-containing protein [Paenibacillus macerans]SUA84922.1 5'-3' exonuclease [Paenibacillus macerans]
MSEHKILVVDGMALLFRAYFAQSYSARRLADGTPTNAIYGFLQYLFDAVNTFNPTHVLCCWDMGSKTFRNELHADYKANRPEAPEDLVPQFSLVKDIVAALDIPNIGLEGYEADDCIGTVSNRLSGFGHVYVLTGDQDMLQLVSERIHVVIMKKGRSNYAVYDLDFLKEDKGIQPFQVVEMKGLTGDTSDNYPGVKGIGEKTALKLLAEYKSIDGILDNLEHLPKSVKAKIEADLDNLHLSRTLARINIEVPIECSLEECLWTVNPDAAADLFEKYRFTSLLKMIG